MQFRSPVKFVAARKFNALKGILVIESDDGYDRDYNLWAPLMKRVASRHSQFIGSKIVVCCPALNTATIGTANKMTVAMVRELVKDGWEPMSHGRHHVGLGQHPVTVQAAAGQNRIDIKGAGMVKVEGGYSYKIWDNVNSEIVVPTQAFGTESHIEDGYVIVNANLQFTYAAGSKFQITPASETQLLQGAIDDLASWGIPCKHHVFTYHVGSEHIPSTETVNVVRNLFQSARGVSGAVNDKKTADLHTLHSLLLNGSLTKATIDAHLNDVSANDKMMIFYGHGDGTTQLMDLLDYLIDGALSRGIRILTRSQAVDAMKAARSS